VLAPWRGIGSHDRTRQPRRLARLPLRRAPVPANDAAVLPRHAFVARNCASVVRNCTFVARKDERVPLCSDVDVQNPLRRLPERQRRRSEARRHPPAQRRRCSEQRLCCMTPRHHFSGRRRRSVDRRLCYSSPEVDDSYPIDYSPACAFSSPRSIEIGSMGSKTEQAGQGFRCESIVFRTAILASIVIRLKACPN